MKDFDNLKKIVRTARNPKDGKPTENNTRVRLVRGTVDEPEVIAVKFHNTDILKYYPDGSLDLVTGWESSPTTNDRIWRYAGIRRYMQALPTFNRRLPAPSKVVCVSHKGEGHIVSSSHDGYIRYNPDGTIDLDSVKEMTFTIWKDQKRLRQLMTAARALADRVDALQKLGFKYTRAVESQFRPVEDWVLYSISLPPEQVDVALIPTNGSTFTDGRMNLHATINSMQWLIGKHYDCHEEVQLKKFFR